MSREVIILKGLPASGKTTWAKKFVEEHSNTYKRINKDDLREMLDAGKWSKDKENFILQMRNRIMVDSLNNGCSVIIDDTNLHSKHQLTVENIINSYNKTEDYDKQVTTRVKLFDATVSECVKRDSKRDNSVGEKVIRRMYKDFLHKEPEKIEYIPELPDVIVCDLDGTLALHNGRSPYDTEKCETDLINEPVWRILESMDMTTLFVSGRSDKYRHETKNWLSENYSAYDGLHMRREGDAREDTIIKKEIYEAEIKGKYNVLFVLDDRTRLVNMWREQGLTCLQVAPGDF